MAYTDYSVTSTIPWYQVDTTTTGTTWYPPYASNQHVQKCQNCGYCSCCGKSDIPGKLTDPENDA